MRLAGIVFLIVAALMFAARIVPRPAPGPDPFVPPPVPAELRAALDRIVIPQEHKQFWAGLLVGLGRFVEADGQSAKPFLVTVSDVAALRDVAVTAPLEPIKGGDLIGETLAPFLSAIGKESEPLVEAGRRKAIADLLIGAGSVLDGN